MKLSEGRKPGSGGWNKGIKGTGRKPNPDPKDRRRSFTVRLWEKKTLKKFDPDINIAISKCRKYIYKIME